MPPELAPLIGLKVLQAYLSPTRKVFCAIFEEQFLMAGASRREIVFTVAPQSEARGFTPGALLPELAGLPLSGVKGDRILFGGTGVRITRYGVQIFREAIEPISGMPESSSPNTEGEG